MTKLNQDYMYNYILGSHLSQNIGMKESSITKSLTISTCTYRTNNICICFTFLFLLGSTNPVIKHIGYMPQMLQNCRNIVDLCKSTFVARCVSCKFLKSGVRVQGRLYFNTNSNCNNIDNANLCTYN